VDGMKLAEDKMNIDCKNHDLQNRSQKGVRKARLRRIRIRKNKISGKMIKIYDNQERAPPEEELSNSYDEFDMKLDELQELLTVKTPQSDAGDTRYMRPGKVQIDACNVEDIQPNEDEVSIKNLVIEGRKHMQVKEFEKALGYFNRALELDHQYLDAWSTKGNLLWETGQDKDPIKNLVIEGKKYMQIKEFDKALICFDLALVLDPQYLDAWSAKGNLLRETTKIKNQ
jgi:tetratricopeptide (TPR) repeat protein